VQTRRRKERKSEQKKKKKEAARKQKRVTKKNRTVPAKARMCLEGCQSNESVAASAVSTCATRLPLSVAIYRRDSERGIHQLVREDSALGGVPSVHKEEERERENWRETTKETTTYHVNDGLL
jgi:hypothetical protein